MTTKVIFPLFILSFSAILIAGCSSYNSKVPDNSGKDSAAGFDIKAMQKIIEEKNNEFAKAFTTGDSATMVNHYTMDGKLFPPNAEAVTGRDAIAAVVSEYLKYGIKEFKDETTALYGDENNLIEEGNFFMGDGKGNTIDKGKYMCVWRKDNGEWKVYSNMFNTSLPPATAK